METLKRRHEEGYALYRKWHPGHIITTMEQLATEDGDWATMVGVHKKALELAPAVIDLLEERLGKELPGLKQEQIDYLIDSTLLTLRGSSERPNFLIQGIVRPYKNTSEGQLVEALAVPWRSIVELLIYDWSIASEIPFEQWERLVAASFDRAGYDEVTLTPRSGDRGRDVIAVKRGVGSVRIVGSVKALKPGRLVRYDDIRALAGVLLSDPEATKGLLTTTSDFPPRLADDPFLTKLIPYRLELMNGQRLKAWLEELALR